MATTTTLMTFLVRCPPNTRSVNLLGSWDNFSKQYPMQRDSRVGSEHWRGCHSFKNIICDGNLDSVGGSRDGGLKMGGTYWYFYELNDDIEFHNSAEPSTTACPLLPGQLVNVLHVPFHLSGSGRGRNASVSSTSSDIRTMDPDTKFLNPRPAPPPRLPRLKTSPPLPQCSDAFESSSTLSPFSTESESSARAQSQPSSATSQRKLRLPRTPRLDGGSRSTSPTKPGFLAALKQITGRGVDVERPDERSRIATARYVGDHLSRPQSRTSGGRVNKFPSTSRSGSRDRSPSSLVRLRSEPGSLLPPSSHYSDSLADIEDGPLSQSFQAHRRHRSRSRDPSPLRTSLTLERDERLEDGMDAFRPAPLATLRETPSQQNSPVWPSTATTEKPDQNKRLPTLPNSPSSAYEDSMHTTSSSKSIDEEALRSHFSAFTISTASGESPSSMQTIEGFESSEYGSTTSPLSETWLARDSQRSPTFSEAATALHSFVTTPRHLSSMPQTPTTEEHDEPFSDLTALPSEQSSSTISSNDSEQPQSPAKLPGLGIGSTETLHQSDKRQAGLFQYKLPNFDESPVDSKQGDSPRESNRPAGYSPVAVRRQNSISETNTALSHSATMQQLLDDLSYLGNMITT